MGERGAMPTSSVSVIINTLNRAELLDDAISGVFQLDHPNFELIVVNGPSTDRTEDVLASWAGKIKSRQCDVPNLSVSRNLGIEAASGEIVAFLDDDAVPHPDWLTNLTRHYANPQVGGVGGFTVDNTGVRWQVRKTICDRFGNAYNVSDFFDERSLNFSGSPFYPSLLGTNSSFRLRALQDIGGFDHTFAYLLDETDVCLRLVDADWHVLYERSALVFHQFAQSHLRSQSRKPRTLYPSVVSKSYFIMRHGKAEGLAASTGALDQYENEISRSNKWLVDHHDISPEHCASLDLDLQEGIRTGLQCAFRAEVEDKKCGDLGSCADPAEFLPAPARSAFRIALLTQGYPPGDESGIARWSRLVAEGLRDRGHSVHVITRGKNLPSRRYQNGIWLHHIVADEARAPQLAEQFDLPTGNMTDWMAAVERELTFLKTFGLDLVSFPIWDLEGLPALEDPDFATILSLHTTYLLARPFKPEWNKRIVYGRAFVDRVIAAERGVLERAPAILANSQAIVDEIEESYGVSLAGRCSQVPHGTTDILAGLGMSAKDKIAERKGASTFKVLVPGRMELRKGYDLALKIAASLADNPSIQFEFAGQEIDDRVRQDARADSGIDINALANVRFLGSVSREDLDRRYAEGDLVMMFSRFESFGLVAVEAMSAATPVLALRAGALPEVVEEGRSGKLLDEDKTLVKRARDFILQLAGDRPHWGVLALGAYEHFQQEYSVPVMVDRLLATYQSAIVAQRRKQA